MSRTASEPQLRFWSNLVSERQRSLGITDVCAAVQALRDQRATAEGVSLSIDKLMRLPVDPPVVVPGAPVRPAGPRPSDAQVSFYTKLCNERCIEPTPEAFTKSTISSEIDRLKRLPRGGPVTTTTSGKRWQDELLGEVPNGYYAIPSVTGTNDLTFFRVFVNRGTVNPEKKGQKLIKQVVGGKGESLPVGEGWARKAIAILFAEGLRNSSALYGQEFKRCGRCHISLTDETSRARGFGSECYGKEW